MAYGECRPVVVVHFRRVTPVRTETTLPLYKASAGETDAPYSRQRFHTRDSCRGCSEPLLPLGNPNLHLLRLERIVTTCYSIDRPTSRSPPSLHKPLSYLRLLEAFCHVCIAVRYQPLIGFLRSNVAICIFSVNPNYSKWQTVMYVSSRRSMLRAVCLIVAPTMRDVYRRPMCRQSCNNT